MRYAIKPYSLGGKWENCHNKTLVLQQLFKVGFKST